MAKACYSAGASYQEGYVSGRTTRFPGCSPVAFKINGNCATLHIIPTARTTIHGNTVFRRSDSLQ